METAVGYCHLKVVNENLYGLKIPKGFPVGVSGGGKVTQVLVILWVHIYITLYGKAVKKLTL